MVSVGNPSGLPQVRVRQKRLSYHLNEVGERSNGSVWLVASVGRDVPFVICDTMGGEGAVGTLVNLARSEVALQ